MTSQQIQRRTKRGRYKSYAWAHPVSGKLYARVQLRQPNVNELQKQSIFLDVRLSDLRRNFSTMLAKLGMENDLRRKLLGH